MNRKIIYSHLDDVLNFISNSQQDWLHNGDISQSLKHIKTDLIHHLLNRLNDDGLIVYKDNCVSRITIEGVIFNSENGYKNQYLKEKWKRIEKWIRFVLLLISGFGVLLTIFFSWMNYNLSRNQNYDKIQQIEKKLDSISNVHRIN